MSDFHMDWYTVSHITIVVCLLWLFLITVHLRKENDKLKARLKSKRWVKFNLNDRVQIQITHVGEDILRGYRQDLNDTMRANGGADFNGALYKMDEDGWTTDRLWAIMQDFSPYIRASGEPPIETELMVEIQESDNE
jgi:hypothetical protein